jgi:hypothetical protein
MRSPLLTLSLARPRYNAESIFKKFELFVYAERKKEKGKVKQSRYRPGVAQRVPGS